MSDFEGNEFDDLLAAGFDEGDGPPPPIPSTPPREQQSLTYEDLFGSPSPERKKRRKDEDKSKSKVELCTTSAVAQLGSRPVQPSVITRAASSFAAGIVDSSHLVIDHYSRIRVFKTSVPLFREQGTSVESVLKDRNFGLEYVGLLNFPFWYRTKGKDVKSFWTSGVLVRKQPGIRKSAKGNEYVIWEINDLKQLDKCWTVFLFSSAAHASSLAEISIGTLIDILGPGVLDDNKGNGSIKFSVNNSTQIRPAGTAKDFGFCQSKRKDGKPCTAVVNTWECCTCVHHAASELKKLYGKEGKKQSTKSKQVFSFYKPNLFDKPPPSKRELLAEGIHTVNFGKPMGHGTNSSVTGNSISTLKPTVKLPPKSFARMELQGSSVCDQFKRNSLSQGNPSSISFKHENDNDRLHQLGGSSKQLSNVPKPPLVLDPLKTRHLNDKDREILATLCSPTKALASQTRNKHKPEPNASSSKQCSTELASRIVSNPSAGSQNFLKYLTSNGTNSNGGIHDTKKNEVEPISMSRHTMNNMKKALEFVRTKGPIQKQDPNSVHKRKSLPVLPPTSLAKANKAVSARLNSSVKDAKARKNEIEVEFDFDSEEFKKILNAKSAHDEHTSDLMQEEYFEKVAKKEAIETKLLNTYTIATNAVMCKQCKYVALSQSDYCREQRHQIRVVKATKRFFKCKDCGNRTMSLDRLPKDECKQCRSKCWLPAPVGKERTGPVLPTEVLSVRGHEEKFLGSSSSQMYLNLEVS